MTWASHGASRWRALFRIARCSIAVLRAAEIRKIQRGDHTSFITAKRMFPFGNNLYKTL